MKIVNLAIGCFYIEGWSYQENLLPKYHKKNGNDVSIIASRFDKDEKDQPKLRDAGRYVNGDGIPVTILDYAKPNFWQKLLRAKPVVGLYDTLCQIDPDIIFVHGGQTITVLDVIKYKKRHPLVKIFADQHGDYYNMPVNNCSWKTKIMNKYIMGYYVRSLAKYVETYWGVTPWRVDYLQQVYRIQPQKTGLLIMGGDDELIDFAHKTEIRKKKREEIGLKESDFVIITGGKIDRTKNIHLLMQAVNKIDNKDLKLVVFGTPNDEMKEEFDQMLTLNANIISIGWLKGKQVNDWVLASDLVVFPGTHSVLWEQAVACGVPAIFKHWEGMTHVDIGGNCIFIEQDSADELHKHISTLLSDNDLYIQMKNAAQGDRRAEFLYSEIARKSIEIR